MDTKALSSAELCPKSYLATSSGSSSFPTVPIRAPPTLDSDTDSSISIKDQEYDNSVFVSSSSSSSYGSDVSGFESEGFLSGEDEFETASERTFVPNPDDESSEKSYFVHNHVGFRPFVNDPYGKNNGFGVSRAYVDDADGEGTSVRSVEGDKFGDYGAELDKDTIENDEFVEDIVVFKPCANDPDEETIEKYFSKAFGANPDNNLTRIGYLGENHVAFRPYLNDPFGESNTSSRAHVSHASGDETSVKSVEKKDGDFGSNPDDNCNENRNIVEDPLIIKPVVNDQCRRINEIGVSRAYVADTYEEEISVKPIGRGGFSETSVGIGISAFQNLSIPIAKLSRDSDDESLVFEDVEDDEFWSSVRIPDTHSLEKTESAIGVKISEDKEFEEETEVEEKYGQESDPALDDKGFENSEMSASVDKNLQLQGGEIGASGTDYFVDENVVTASTKMMEESENFVIDCDNEIHSSDGIKHLKLVESDYANLVKKDNLGTGMEDETRRSYNVSDPLINLTLDLEFSGEFKEKEDCDQDNLERSFSVDDMEQTLSPSALEKSSKDFWLKTERILIGDFNNDMDTREESEEKQFLDPKIYANSPRQNLSEDQKKKVEKIQLLTVKFNRLVQRLSLSLEDPIVSQVLYQLFLIERGPSNQLFTFGSDMNIAMGHELGDGSADFDFALNILVIGKIGVGKSATINSIFGEEKASVSAFEPATTYVKEIFGTINEIKVIIFDTPGLRPSPKEQSYNRRILSSAKRLMRKHPPDIVLYVDRLDMETRDLNDLPLLMSITRCLGSSIWQKTIITLTHAGSTPPDGPNGLPLSYDLFVAQRLHTIQSMISQSLGRNVLDLSSVSSVSLVENHYSSSLEGEDREKLLLNGENWRSRLLLLCSSMKILSEANLVAKNQDLLCHREIFGVKFSLLPLPHLLSSLSHLETTTKLEDEYEYDQLPQLKPWTKALVKDKFSVNELHRGLVNLSVMRSGGGIEWGENLQSQLLSLGLGLKMVLQAGFDDKLNGQILVKISGSEQLQIVFFGFFTMVNAIAGDYFSGSLDKV